MLTIDTLLPQRQVAQTIVDKGRDYVMIVKGAALDCASLGLDLSFPELPSLHSVTGVVPGL